MLYVIRTTIKSLAINNVHSTIHNLQVTAIFGTDLKHKPQPSWAHITKEKRYLRKISRRPNEFLEANPTTFFFLRQDSINNKKKSS